MTNRIRTAALLSALVLTGCARPAESPPAAPREPATLSDFSVYDLDGDWYDQDGHERELSSLRGRVQVVAMVYTHCGHTCPLIIAEFKRIQAALPPESRDDVGFVLASIDPERDTPERLAEFAASMRLDPESWTLLSADDERVRELAALIGIRYRRESANDYSHSNSYLVLDEEGRIAYRRDGLGGPREAVLARIADLTD